METTVTKKTRKYTPAYTRGKYNILNRIDARCDLVTTKEIKAHLKELAEKNNLSISKYMSLLIKEAYSEITPINNIEEEIPDVYPYKMLESFPELAPIIDKQMKEDENINNNIK